MDINNFDLPRRGLLGCGLASFALAAPSWAANPAGASNGFQPLPAEVRLSGHHLTTQVFVNGKGPFRFIVDTGADRSVLSEEVAQALRLPIGKQVTVQGIIRAIPAPSAPVRELKFGVAVRSNLQMPVLPRQLLQADGFLGLDAIGTNRVVFDFARRQLRVFDSVPSSFMELNTSDTRILAQGYNGHLRSVECRVDGISTVAFIDSGAEVSVGNSALHRALMGQGPGYRGDRDIELSGITGGSRMGRVVRVETILFGNLEFTGCELAAADLDIFRIWELGEQPALLIGLNFLRQFETITVDYGRKEFRLKLAQGPSWVNRKRA